VPTAKETLIKVLALNGTAFRVCVATRLHLQEWTDTTELSRGAA